MRRFLFLLLALALLMALDPHALAEQDIIVIDGDYAAEPTDAPADLSAPDTELLPPGQTPPAPQPTPFTTLQRGAHGETVAALQRLLTVLGYYNGKISGDFLDGTDAATRAFQRQNGLAVNGKVTATTWYAMTADTAIRKDGRTAGEAPAHSAPPIPTLGPGQTASATGFVFLRVLQYGAQGADVRALQQRLASLDYYTKEISGNFLGNTRNALRAFQKNNGLKADGVAGEQTQQALWDAQALDARATPRPTPTPAPLRYMLRVDVTNQVTTAYELDERGEYTIPVRQMICSTGTRANPTPIKTIQGAKGRARWGYFPEWGSHAQYLTRIDSRNAFHSVLYSEPTERALVIGAYNALGSRASHGCVRLLVADAKWIYDNCLPGTTIEVFEGAPDPELTQMLKPPPLDRRTMLPQATPAPTPPLVWDENAAPPPYRTLKKGATGADVWWLQAKLTALGYYHGTISAGYYEGTIAAVKAFQQDAGLTVDGAAGPITLQRLYEGEGAPGAQTTGQTPAPGRTAAPIPAPVPGSLLVVPTPTPAPRTGGLG
ncbi:MAG: peptidoglycan-binding protein [Oscillospiraceae bacterium]|jgi:peptidoglycan hydrolase-like protein with peptidoglycan-binding domain|nr:peptidoglycan-binding protein [Oscillospiraceae bacterium]